MIIKNNDYNNDFMKDNMMGPNSMRIMWELSESLKLEKGMRVLDLGCGKGLTSIFLAKEYGVTVFATDLWISATDNYARIIEMGLKDKIIPIHAEAHDLPFAQEYFDIAVSVDAYHYFGVEEDYLSKYLAPLVRKNGQIGIAVPGLKKEFRDGIPKELKPYWTDDMNFHSCEWWLNLWRKSQLVEVQTCNEMKCFTDAWNDWLLTNNEHTINDAGMMKAEGGNYFNLVLMTANKIK